MASLNDRTAGQDFEGNGPSSFDPRDYDFGPATGPDLSDPHWEAKVAAVKAAEAHIALAFGPIARARYEARQAALVAPAQRVAA